MGKRSESRENARARGQGRENLQRSLINFHFHAGNPGTQQSVTTVTANMPQIRKVTTACQVSFDSRGRVGLLILFINRFRKSIKAMFLITDMFYFPRGLQRVRSDKNSLLLFSFRLLLKRCPYCSVEVYSPSQSPTKTSYICPSGTGEQRFAALGSLKPIVFPFVWAKYK